MQRVDEAVRESRQVPRCAMTSSIIELTGVPAAADSALQQTRTIRSNTHGFSTSRGGFPRIEIGRRAADAENVGGEALTVGRVADFFQPGDELITEHVRLRGHSGPPGR